MGKRANNINQLSRSSEVTVSASALFLKAWLIARNTTQQILRSNPTSIDALLLRTQASSMFCKVAIVPRQATLWDRVKPLVLASEVLKWGSYHPHLTLPATWKNYMPEALKMTGCHVFVYCVRPLKARVNRSSENQTLFHGVTCRM